MLTVLLRLVNSLPGPMRSFAYWAIESFAQFILLMMVIPILVLAFITATVVVGVMTGVLGLSMPGPLGGVIAVGWLASWTVLPAVITVRMWRSIPALKDLVRLANGSTDVEAAVPMVPTDTADPATFKARIARLDAKLADTPRDDPE